MGVDLGERAPDGRVAAAADIGRFARVDLAGACLALVVVVVVNTAVLRSGVLWIVPAVLAVLALCLLGAIRASDRGRPDSAIALITAGHWSVAVVAPIALPFLWPIGVLVVVLPLVLAAPLVDLRVLVRMIAGAAATVAAVAVIGLGGDDRGAVPDIDDDLELVIVVSALAVLMVPIALVVWQNNRRQQRALDDAIRLNTELVRSRRRVVEAADDARRRIERDLHDGAQQRLVALAMRLRAADSAGGTADVGGLVGEVDRTLDELRALAHGVYPPVLSTHGLTAALRAVAQESGGRVVVRGGDDHDRPERGSEEALYFTGLEAIANASKHATNGGVEVTVDGDAATITVIVSDAGPGFEFGDVDARSGLANMRDRVESLGGDLSIESAPGEPTTVTARVPRRPRALPA